MNVNDVWLRRLGKGRRSLLIGAGIILAVPAVLGGTSTVWSWIDPPAPLPVAEMALDTINSVDPVQAFAVNCTTGVLTATVSGTDLARCSAPGNPYTLATRTLMTVTNPLAWATKRQVMSDDVTIYTVKVQVDERPYPSASAVTAYYQMSVAVYRGQGMQALDRIGRVAGPPPGAEVPLGYDAPIKTDSPLYGVLRGFTTAYLANTGDLSRYTTTDSGITALGTYAKDTTTLVAAQAETTPPDDPQDNTELAVHIDVSAPRADYSKTDELSYPLTLRSVGGTWFVARIDAVPVVADATPTPTPTPQKEAHQ